MTKRTNPDQFIKKLQQQSEESAPKTISPATTLETTTTFTPFPESGQLSDESSDSSGKEHSQSSLEEVIRAIIRIPLHLLDDSPYQPRLKYDQDYLESLAASMAESGQKEPVTCRRAGGRFELIAGHCRKRAAGLLAWPDLEADLVELDDRAAEVATLIQADTRRGISEFERSCIYHRAMVNGLATNQTAVARMFGVSQARVCQALILQTLPEPILAIARSNPAPFGYRTANVIRDAIKDHPNDVDLIINTVRTNSDEGKMIAVGSAIRNAIAAKSGNPLNRPESLVVADISGHTLFISRADRNKVTVNVPRSRGIPIDRVQESIMKALRKLADEIAEEQSTPKSDKK